jgi:hypothetical protein
VPSDTFRPHMPNSAAGSASTATSLFDVMLTTHRAEVREGADTPVGSCRAAVTGGPLIGVVGGVGCGEWATLLLDAPDGRQGVARRGASAASR